MGLLKKSHGLAVALCSLALASEGVFAQSEYDDDIRELKQKLEKLDEAVRQAGQLPAEPALDIAGSIAELRADIEALERQVAASQAQPQSITGLKTEDVAALEPGEQGTLSPLQRNSEEEYLTGKDLLDEAFPNSLPIPGTDVRFKVSGYAKADVIHDFDYVGDRYEFELGSIPVKGTPEAELDGLTTIHAKESRIGFDFRTIARNEDRGWKFPLRAFLEVDFFDDRDDFRLQPRLRHAYGVVGRFTAGRTWAITTDLAALAPTVDFSGGDALYGGRVSQLRFSDRINESLTYAVGIEESFQSIGNPLSLDGSSRSSLPNFAGYLSWEGDNKAHLRFSADVFRLEWQGGSAGPSDTEMGYGVSLTGRYQFGTGQRDSISGSITTGSGAANRVISLSWDGGNSAVITPDGLDAMEHFQIYGAFTHYWTDSLHSAFTAAYAELDNSRWQTGNAIHSATSAHVNLVWFPYKSVSTGVEYMWGRRENNDGSDGTANRMQFMVKYLFN